MRKLLVSVFVALGLLASVGGVASAAGTATGPSITATYDCRTVPKTSTVNDGVPGPIFWARMQCLGRGWGYTGPVDGVMGPNSWKAVQRYMDHHGWYDGPIDGNPGAETRKGLQRWAKARGGYDGPISGTTERDAYKALARVLNAMTF